MQEDQELLVDGVCGRQSWDRLFDFR
jgi:hypothetical protein